MSRSEIKYENGEIVVQLESIMLTEFKIIIRGIGDGELAIELHSNSKKDSLRAFHIFNTPTSENIIQSINSLINVK